MLLANMAPLHQDMSTSEGQSPVATISIPTDFASLASICLFLTLLAVTLRVFTKVVDLRRMQSDDCKYYDFDLKIGASDC